MPELPEVETVRRGLEPYLEGATLADVQLHRLNLRYPFPERFADQLAGATVTRLDRRAKYLLFHLDTQKVWVTHLGMTGRFQVGQQGVDGNYYHVVATDTKHRHFSVNASRNGVSRTLDFYDPRRFGFMLLLTPAELYATAWFKSLGVEPLSDDLNPAYLMTLAKDRKTNLKALLMAQGGIAGLGNIYVCEALWRARLSPERTAGKLYPREAIALTSAIKAVLEEAVCAGGSSISDFAAATGELGMFQHRFCVYGRKGQPCPRDDGGSIERKVHQGRSTFHCPICQV
ncbi:bifunctional DNA-formamidopyrimidine glycosylase/DNA-(apurinic or apyrimidinic site) lyase [Asticcacaulis sp. AC402]|uniref:bifunctional DNA-formamidopyrimidine glycosylase/DNA-(apurinic or apyrimidinic site) lyase n=1 Tax=Asticcacaulis sp. AC402 TaxID=1282361 RepID=UPI0003C3E3BB|nr:bifunctional DNA-formamidopyrimidine glycosylase/DNA-(apurinic or apyrimidinic site) lyase [Asticcacaulis sp. AC402]ESQ74946.1 formamidopyrimidine-DNA glycosylase [Asticcacaulis sp. AC402]